MTTRYSIDFYGAVDGAGYKIPNASGVITACDATIRRVDAKFLPIIITDYSPRNEFTVLRGSTPLAFMTTEPLHYEHTGFGVPFTLDVSLVEEC